MVKARLCCAYNESLWTIFVQLCPRGTVQSTYNLSWLKCIDPHSLCCGAKDVHTLKSGQLKKIHGALRKAPFFFKLRGLTSRDSLAHLTYGGAGSAASKHSMKRIWKLKVQWRARKESNFCLSSDQGSIHSIFLGWLVRSGWSRLLTTS